MRIDQLTDEQAAMLPVIRDEWIRAGLSTEPADRAAAEAGVRKAYAAAGLEPPRLVIWLDSPLAGAIGQAIVRTPPRTSARVQAQVWAQVRDQVGDQVGDQVRAQVEAQVRAQVWAQVEDWCTGALGRWECGWLSFYAALGRLGIDVSRLDGLVEIERSAGWWWPMRDAVVLTDRPSVISRDKDGRLHSAAGPAVLYRDGFAVHAWHGTRVPADLIETGWDTARILREPNAEVRRCAIERMGWDVFIASSGMRQVGDAVPDPGNAPHTLALYDLPDTLSDMFEEPARILLCTNGSPERDGTRHRFGLVVPGHHTDPVAAAADLYDIPVQAYRQLEVRR